MKCPRCGSVYTKKKGLDNKSKKQLYLCHLCGRKFTSKFEKNKRIIIISDTHCGHIHGLTPLVYRTQYNEHAFKFQTESWTWFQNVVNIWKPFDMLIANGDLIDGRGEKSGGTELITGDRMRQSQIAADIINEINANTVLIIRGTDYHTGQAEQFEDHIADLTGAQDINDRMRFSVNGNLFDVRHHVGNSSVPWSDLTSPMKELILYNLDRREDVNLMIRSHIHKFTMGSTAINQMVITTPGLQGNSSYGVKKCIGRTDYGIIIVDIDQDGSMRVIPVITKIDSLESQVTEF